MELRIVRLVELLLEASPHCLNARDERLRTPLVCAVFFGRWAGPVLLHRSLALGGELRRALLHHSLLLGGVGAAASVFLPGAALKRVRLPTSTTSQLCKAIRLSHVRLLRQRPTCLPHLPHSHHGPAPSALRAPAAAGAGPW